MFMTTGDVPYLQAGDMGSARMGLGATVHRFKKVCYVFQYPDC